MRRSRSSEVGYSVINLDFGSDNFGTPAKWADISDGNLSSTLEAVLNEAPTFVTKGPRTSDNKLLGLDPTNNDFALTGSSKIEVEQGDSDTLTLEFSRWWLNHIH